MQNNLSTVLKYKVLKYRPSMLPPPFPATWSEEGGGLNGGTASRRAEVERRKTGAENHLIWNPFCASLER